MCSTGTGLGASQLGNSRRRGTSPSQGFGRAMANVTVAPGYIPECSNLQAADFNNNSALAFDPRKGRYYIVSPQLLVSLPPPPLPRSRLQQCMRCGTLCRCLLASCSQAALPAGPPGAGPMAHGGACAGVWRAGGGGAGLLPLLDVLSEQVRSKLNPCFVEAGLLLGERQPVQRALLWPDCLQWSDR